MIMFSFYPRDTTEMENHAKDIVNASSTPAEAVEKYHQVSDAMDLGRGEKKVLLQFTFKESVKKFGLDEVTKLIGKNVDKRKE